MQKGGKREQNRREEGQKVKNQRESQWFNTNKNQRRKKSCYESVLILWYITLWFIIFILKYTSHMVINIKKMTIFQMGKDNYNKCQKLCVLFNKQIN